VHPHGFVTVLCTMQSAVTQVLGGQFEPLVLVIVTQEIVGLAVMVERVVVGVEVGVEAQRRLVS
jgi:hypothetical protein